MLQILDEMYRGYQDSRWVLDADQLLGRGREPSTGMTLLDGQIAGSMTRTVTPDALEIRINPLRALSPREVADLHDVVARYARFLDRTPVLRLE